MTLWCHKRALWYHHGDLECQNGELECHSTMWHHSAGFEGTKYSNDTVHAHIALIYHISPVWSHKLSNIHTKMNQWTYAFR